MKKFYLFTLLFVPLLFFVFGGCNRTERNPDTNTGGYVSNNDSLFLDDSTGNTSNQNNATNTNSDEASTDPASVDVNASLNELNTLKSQAESSQKSLDEADNVDESLNNTTSKVE